MNMKRNLILNSACIASLLANMPAQGQLQSKSPTLESRATADKLIVVSTPDQAARGPHAFKGIALTSGGASAERGSAPPNDLACDAPVDALAVGGTLAWSGTLDGATDTEGFGLNSVWQAFTLTSCAEVTLNWCGTAPLYPLEYVFMDRGACDLFVYEYYPFGDPLDCGDGNPVTYFQMLQSGTYYVPIVDVDGSGGTYSIAVSASPCPPPPPNDQCSDVVPMDLTPGTPLLFEGTTLGATIDGDTTAGVPSDVTTPIVWHAFTLAGCANVTVEYCPNQPGFAGIYVVLAQDCPMDGNLVYSSYDFEQCTGELTLEFWELPAGTYYLPIGGNVYNALVPYAVAVSAAACGPYCAAWAQDAINIYDKIANVTFVGIDNTSTFHLGYEDFTSVSGLVATGSTHPISITLSDAYAGDQALVWIDFDQDHTFQADELVYTSPTSAGPYTGSISIPVDALLGNTRMRVRLHDAAPTHGANDTPCGMSNYGQVEDYTLMIEDGTGINTINTPAFNVFPDPSNGAFTIQSTTMEGNVRVELLDQTGRLVLQQQHVIDVASGVIHINAIGSVAAGAYVLRLSTSEGLATRRITIR